MERKITFIKYVSLNMLSMLGLSCYILADTLFIANGVGSLGLAALNLILPLYNVIIGLGLLIGVGSATRFSIVKVQQDNQHASLYFTAAIKLAFLTAIPITILGFFFASSIMVFMGATQDILDIASTYLKTFIIFAPFFIIQQIVVTFIRNDNNPRLASLAMIMGTLFNIIFDYIFIFPYHLGMFGAALATGFSPVVTLLICSLHFIGKKNHFHFNKAKLNLQVVWQIFTIGIPSFITELSTGIIIFIFNMVIFSIGGNIAIASYGIISNLALVMTSLYTGIAQGVQPLFSQSYAQNNFHLNKSYFHYSIIITFMLSTFIYICILLFSHEIVALFNSENNLQMAQMASHGLPLYFFGFFFSGLNMIFISYFASIEKIKPSFLISLLRGGLIIIPLVFLLASLFLLDGVWLSFPISEAMILLISLFFFKQINAKKEQN